MNIRQFREDFDRGSFKLTVINGVLHCDLAEVMRRVGLIPKPEHVRQVDEETAVAILERWLWKDAAYEGERMPREKAASYAREFVSNHLAKRDRADGALVYANVDEEPFNNDGTVTFRPCLEDSNMDGGLLIFHERGDYAACLWFADED